nr:hypothetical protein [Clostridia bacterium]
MLRKHMTKIVSMLLSMAMVICAVPAPAYALMVPKPEDSSELVIPTADGGTITPGSDWEETYPYGAFALDNSGIKLEEGGDEGVIKVYRLGGTEGRATILLEYAPVIYAKDDMTPNYGSALSSDDITIYVEDILPAAPYQPVGKDPAPQEPDEDVVPEMSEPNEDGDIRVTIPVEAESWQWQLLLDGEWEDINLGTEDFLLIAEDDIDDFDVRCVYTADGVSYCSDSLKGVEYVRPEDEELPEAPEDLVIYGAPEYLELAMDDDDVFSGYRFPMTFADGEWVKEIHLQIDQDDIAEPEEFATLIIRDCEGGDILDAASTMIIEALDDDEAEDSEIGFEVTEIEADKAYGSAELTVVRTGGTQEAVTVHYETVNGSAKAGRDFVAASGDLAFYAGVDEMKIRIELIDDGVAADDGLYFFVELSDLKGAGGSCTLADDSAEIDLYNSGNGKASEANLATVLYDSNTVDVSEDLEMSDTVAAPGPGKPIGGTQVKKEAQQAAIGASDDELSLLTYDYSGHIIFPQGTWKSKDYMFDEMPEYWWEGKADESNTFYSNPYLNEMFSNISGTLGIAAAVDWAFLPWDSAYTDPYFAVLDANDAIIHKYQNHTYLESEGTSYYFRNDGELYTIDWDIKLDSAGQNWKKFIGKNVLKNGGSSGLSLSGVFLGYGDHNDWQASRRNFTGSFDLKIFTANDSDSAVSGAAVLNEAAGAYNSIKPKINFNSAAGSLESNGENLPFVGSSLNVTIPNSSVYSPVYKYNDGGSVITGLYMINKTTKKVVKRGDVQLNGNDVTGYNMQLAWDGMTDADLKADYTICLVVERKQIVTVEVAPSVPRLVDENGKTTDAIDTSRIGEAIDMFMGSGSSSHTMTYGYTSINHNESDFYQNSLSSKTLTLRQKSTNSTELVSGKLSNVQYLSFGLPHDDLLLYNGRTYHGDETIWLAQKDLSVANITVRYYQKDYAAMNNVMTAIIGETLLYLDANRNGRIDGYFNKASGLFTLTPVNVDDVDVYDEFIMFMSEGEDYDESIVAPQAFFNEQGELAGYAQHIMKVYYTITPRNLMIPAGGEDMHAQVLPAFVTDVTSSSVLSEMSREQKSYRYILSSDGRTYDVEDVSTLTLSDSDYGISSDGHVMYGSAASEVQFVDIPLGGDMDQMRISGDTITWTPDYQGNLIADYEYPSPIKIFHHLAGSNIPLAETETDSSERGWSYTGTAKTSGEAAGIAQINGYLGSYSYNDTYALGVQEQQKAASSLAAEDLDPESVTRYDGGLMENGEYLKVMSGADAPDISADTESQSTTGAGTMSSHGDDDDEEAVFNMDIGTQLPTIDLGATDYVSVTLDGYELGISIGIPMGGYDSNGDAGQGGVGQQGQQSQQGSGSKWFGPPKANKSNKEDLSNLKNWLFGDGEAGDVDDSWKNANATGTDKQMTAKSFKVNFTLAFAALLTYDPVINTFALTSLTVAAQAGIEATVQVRLTVPVFYFFIHFTAEVEIKSGMGFDRTPHYLDVVVEPKYVDTEKDYSFGDDLKKDKAVEFDTDIKAFSITFDGKLYLDYGDSKRKGIIESDGSEPVLIVINNKSKNGGKIDLCTVTLTSKGGEDGQGKETDVATIESIRLVDDTNFEVYWDGVTISPELSFEVGFGCGITVLKVELFAKIGFGAEFHLGDYEKKYKGDGTYTTGYSLGHVESVEFDIGLAVRAVALILTFEMDLAHITIAYDHDEDEWTKKWAALGDHFSGDLDEDSPGGDITIRLLANTSKTQRFNGGGARGELETLAYETFDAPFEISGYGSSGDAFTLMDGVETGYDYRVVSDGTDNYMIYTISRDEADVTSELDNKMLVISKIKVTAGPNGSEKYGLVNPVDEDDTEYPYYAVIDDDGTGDLEFDVVENGGDLELVWVSYDGEHRTGIAGNVIKPSSECPEGMNKYNYRRMLADHPDDPVYEAWAAYFEATGPVNDVRKLAYNASKYHSQVKTAALMFNGQAAPSISEPVTVPAGAGKPGSTAPLTTEAALQYTGYSLYIPRLAKDAVFFGQGVHYTEPEIGEKASAYEEHYNTLNTGYSDQSVGSAAVSESLADFNVQTSLASWELLGKYSELHAYVDGEDVYTSLCKTDNEGQFVSGEVLQNVTALKKSASSYWVSYTTGQEFFTKVGRKDDYVHVYRLYLRELKKTSNGWEWQDALLLRTLINYDRNNDLDGVYSAFSTDADDRSKAFEEPYFADLKFLNGKIGNKLENGELITLDEDDVPAEDFLLFEMNGASYIINEESLENLIGGSGDSYIYPFFKVSAEEEANTKESAVTGRSSVTIGTDSAGNVAAVYTGPVSGSLSNAVYITRFDPHAGEWGAGVMLAMRGMQIHEDSVARGWSKADTENAFLGKLSGYTNKYGTMHQFTFSNLQAAMGGVTYTDNDGNPQTKDTLLVLTQGNMMPLKEETVSWGGKDKTFIGPDNSDAAAGDHYQGVYALSYGIGGQAIGNDSLSFLNYSFTAGSREYPQLSFMNTGDVSIRASESDPALVKLKVTKGLKGDPVELAAWEITKNVRPGETVELYGEIEMPFDVPAGSAFYITVEEDEDYVTGSSGTQFKASTLNMDGTGTLVVEEKPELALERVEMIRTGVDENGNTLFDLSFIASNRGNEEADDVYVQFQYIDGTDEAGDPAYAAFDLANSEFTVSGQSSLGDLGLLADDLTGKLVLADDQGEDDIDPGMGRTVTGKLVVPSSCYTGVNGSFDLKMEIFSNADILTSMSEGAVKVRHGEYNGNNNVFTQHNEHYTYITAPGKIMITMGNTMRIPVQSVSTLSTSPVLTATEAPNIEGDPNCLGILYVDADNDTLVVFPSREGGGTINLYDADTNTTRAVTFTVIPPGEGINIYRGNDLFTFTNSSGDVYDQSLPQAGQSWSFWDSVPTWGDGDAEEIPSNGDLSAAGKDSVLEFDTVAVSLDLYFSGKISVSIDGGTPYEYTGEPGNAPTNIGVSSGGSLQHHVKITVLEDGALFDRVVENYDNGHVPLPPGDSNAPQLYWSRSFPDMASMEAGAESVAITLFILEDSGLNTVKIDGVEPENVEKISDVFWQIPMTISVNGEIKVSASDISGNTTNQNVMIDWFALDPVANAVKSAPSIDKTVWMKSSDDGESWNELTDTEAVDSEGNTYTVRDFITNGQMGALDAEASAPDDEVPAMAVKVHKSLVASGSYGWSVITIDQNVTSGLYPVDMNGLYQVTATAENGTWATKFIEMDRFATTYPLLIVNRPDPENDPMYFTWVANRSENSNAKIGWAAINGHAVYPWDPGEGQQYCIVIIISGDNPYYQDSLNGSFRANLGGNYTVTVSDEAGQSRNASIYLDPLPIAIADDCAEMTPAIAQGGLGGSAVLKPSGVSGGLYDASISSPHLREYIASYEYAFMAKDELTEDGSAPDGTEWTAFTEDVTVEDLATGTYVLLVRDANDPENVSTMNVSVPDNSIRIETEISGDVNKKGNGSVTVTASGGKDGLGIYQYVLIPVEKGTTEPADVSTLTGWQNASMPLKSLDKTVIDGLAAGDYQLGVRLMAGVTEEEMSALGDLYDEMTAAEDALKK